ncbi:MAG TPA: bifunctional molybdenum cofactor biosynthesis protein MoaC/MoaB [archaeon]|nr:bifunctional molybdenum cofactor biosynthesis protein MoaC/MoaB [archaeon]
MRDISRKINTLRTAQAAATLVLKPSTLELVRQEKIPKGDPLEVARVAAIQAAKETSRIIPYCHPVPVDFVGVHFALSEDRIEVRVEVKALYRTGVEMEALTGVSVAALTLYDMLKMLDDSMEIKGIRLLEKKGGKSDFAQELGWVPRAGVLVTSDSVSRGAAEDRSGRLIQGRLTEEGFEVADLRVVPDNIEEIKKCLIDYADLSGLDLVVTSGGTGLGPRDVTPEATLEVCDREVPGIEEAARSFGTLRTPFAVLSRGRAGIRGKTLIINLPGSTRGVEESLDALSASLKHALKIIRGGGH